MKKIFICSGDPSGDIHAAELMKEIKILNQDIEFIGIGGKKMIDQGLKSIADMKDISVVGFWEVARKYNFFKKLLKNSQDIIKNENIELFIPVDYPGFNLRLGKFAKKNNIPVVYYIAPQLWAWGKNRAKNLAESTDKLLVVFPFEHEYFSGFGIDTEFVGHPLLDYEQFRKPFPRIDERLNLIAYLPGSRLQEVKRHLNFLDDINICQKAKMPDYKIAILRSSNINRSIYDEYYRKNKLVEFFDDSSELFKNSKAGIIKTGTSNLECCLSGLPFAMFYKTSALTYNLAKKMINLPYISIVNILSNQFVVKEFIQSEAKPEKMIDYIKDVVENHDLFHSQQTSFQRIREMLGGGGAARKAAEIVYKYL